MQASYHNTIKPIFLIENKKINFGHLYLDYYFTNN